MTTPWTTYQRRIPWHPADGDRVLPLGRHVNHDSRNLAYPYRRSAPVIVTRLHTRQIPILDQGSVGSCTGNAQVGVMGTEPNYGDLPNPHMALDEALALRIYSDAEMIDGDGPYPPNDYGSSGPSAAKAAMKLGLISGYTHCLSLHDVLDALQVWAAVSIGINWYDSFDSPSSSGLIAISPGASVRGGHEPMLRGVDAENKTVFGDNSWGAGWGLKGSFYMSWDTLTRLLAEEGDGTVSIPSLQPAPVPVPPTPTPTPIQPADLTLYNETRAWARARHVGSNRAAAGSVARWAKAKGL